MLYLILSAVLTQGATPQGGPPPPFRGQDPVLVGEEVFQATVLSIEDGDTLNVRAVAGGEASVIHVAGVDAPEPSQPGGPEAKAFLANLVSGKTITVRLKGALERVAQVEIDGVDVSLLLIKNGMAWHCPRFTNERLLTAAEAEARSAKRGVWSRPQPTPPWIYRGAGVCWEQRKAPAKLLHLPDFSGRWEAVSPSERAGQKLTIVQTRDTLTIQHESAGSGEPTAYKLEGTTSRSFTTAYGPADSVAKSRWNGVVWTIDERVWVVRGEEARNSRRRIWLDEAGLLNVETSSPRPIGEYDSTVVRYRLSVVSR